MDERRISLGGLTTRYVSAGRGRPVVLLHALGEDWSQWSGVLDGLAPRYRLHALDLPGFGAGGRPPCYTAAWFASFVAAFVEEVAGEPVALVTPAGVGELAVLWAKTPTVTLTASSPGRRSSSGTPDTCRALGWHDRRR